MPTLPSPGPTEKRRAPAGEQRSPAGGGFGGPFLLPTSLWASKEKYGRAPARNPKPPSATTWLDKAPETPGQETHASAKPETTNTSTPATGHQNDNQRPA